MALSSIVRAMEDKQVMAIARWVSKDGMDPKMGVLSPVSFEQVDCLLWAQVGLSAHSALSAWIHLYFIDALC